MSERVIKLPDVGEGVAEAEIVELMVKVGEPVREGDVLAAVMTDKATVEIPSPTDGRVSWIGCEVGQKAAVGSELMKIEIGDGADTLRELAARTKGAAPADRDGEQLQRPQQPESAQELSQLASDGTEQPPPIDPAASKVPRNQRHRLGTSAEPRRFRYGSRLRCSCSSWSMVSPGGTVHSTGSGRLR